MEMLIAALAAFVGTHFLLSHPLRAPIVGIVEERLFPALYSLVALGTFAWVIMAFRAAPSGMPLWEGGDGLWLLATLLMLVGSILFVGSLIGNPALPVPPDVARAVAAKPARGVFAITRHPMMWGFAIWAIVHLLVSPQPKVVALTVAIGLLALGGSKGQDAKKEALMGESWREWEAQTSFLPFAHQISGKSGWSNAWPGRTVVLVGIVVWLLATRLHPMLGAPVAGVWRWIG